MADERQFSDDISELWGADDTSVLHPAPLRPAGRTDDDDDRGDGRVGALEGHLRALTEAVQSMRGEVLAQVDAALAASERRIAEAGDLLAQRLAALERYVEDGLAELPKGLAGPGHTAEVEATLHQRLDDLDAQLRAVIDGYRREAVPNLELDAIRADLQAAADAIAARTDEQLSQRFRELAAHVTRATTSQLAGLDQRVARLGDLLDSHRVQSVMGWELESLRTELVGAVTTQLAELRAELREELRAELGSNASQADEERRRLEASWQQSMPGF